MNLAFSIYPAGLHDERKQPCPQGVSCSIICVLPTGESIIFTIFLNIDKWNLTQLTTRSLSSQQRFCRWCQCLGHLSAFVERLVLSVTLFMNVQSCGQEVVWSVAFFVNVGQSLGCVVACVQHWCVPQRLQQSHSRGSPGADFVQRYSWIVHALLFHVLAVCTLLCQRGVCGFSLLQFNSSQCSLPIPPNKFLFPLSYLARV